ncbi:MAG: hypothetical protein K8S16_10620 [Bacteroidales bacterium]|nr:hypothetical protein [Bacteroidales bacterium]
MIKYLIKIFYFTIPFLLYILFIIVVDPYNFINISHIFSDNQKIAVLNRSNESGPRGNMLWKVVKYKRNPIPIVLLGDSQGRKIKESIIKKASGEDCFNFCVPGASYSTMFENFWYVANQTKLIKVYFAISFMNYNSKREYSLNHFASDYTDSPYNYFITKEILFDSFVNLLFYITNDSALVQNPYEKQAVDVLDKFSESKYELFFGDYMYPDHYFEELKKISEYCRNNQIELTFIILPTYEKMGEYIESRNDLLVNYNRFKDDIKKLAPIIDFDIPGEEIRGHRAYFFDYFHLRQAALDDLTFSIWKNN